MLALRGPNGSGKSSLLRILAGLSRPEAGRVEVAGAEARGAVHYLGHQDGLRAALSVAENLAFILATLGRGGGLALASALESLGIETLAKLPVSVLSAGQRRRVALAGLLMAARPIWLLDEPNAALDDEGTSRLAGLLEAHIERGGIAIAATHLPLGLSAPELRLGAPVPA